MNTHTSNELISEDDIRVALRPLRPSRADFAAAVRQKVNLLSELRDHDSHSRDYSGDSSWLRIAASLLPVHLVGKGLIAKGAGGTFAQLTVGQKVLAIFALPAVSLILIALTVLWAFLRIRHSVLRQEDTDVDMERLTQATQHSSILIFAASMLMIGGVILPIWFGMQLPAFIFFLAPAIMLVLVAVQLSRRQMLDRSIIASLCSSILGLLGILGHGPMISSTGAGGTPLLDQRIIASVMYAGLGVVLAAQSTIPRFNVPDPQPISRRLSFPRVAGSLACGSMLLFAAWFGRSLWQPVTTSDLKTYVESFDRAKYSSASWQQWSVPAKWLADQEIELDFARPRQLLRETIKKEDQLMGHVLYHAMEGGLVGQPQVGHVFDVDLARERVFGGAGVRRVGFGFQRRAISIRALAIAEELDESEKDELGEYFEAAMDDLKLNAANRFPLKEARQITELARVVDRPIDIDVHRIWVHQTLCDYQRLNKRLGQPIGGFSASAKLDFSNDEATTQAIELMQAFGVPDGVDLLALRSYLRPTMTDRFGGLKPQACIRVASLQRLESLPDVPPLTWTDYFRCEQNLIMSILLVLLCIFATLTAPNLRRNLPGTTVEPEMP